MLCYPIGWSTSLVTDCRKSSQIKLLQVWVVGFWSKVPHSPPLQKASCNRFCAEFRRLFLVALQMK